MHILGLISLALAPGMAISLFVYLHDRHEREPVWLLFASFVYGAFSTLLSLLLSVPLATISEHWAPTSAEYVFVRIALVEELSKFLFLRFVLFYSRYFNEPFDGIVYAIMIGMGFATAENIVYVFQYGLTTGVLRMFTAVPAHAVFAVLMGYFIGRVKFTHSHAFTYSLLALFSAALFHGFYDYFWLTSFVPGIALGAIVSIVLTFALGRKALRLHDQSRVFIEHNEDANVPGRE